jgi:DNA-binding response OmpR family regulator
MRLLLVESDPIAADDLAYELRRQGLLVDTVGTGAEVFAASDEADLVLLGLELPDLDGLEVCRRLRERCQVPIIALSCGNNELDRVLGLQAGLDDYVTKPFRVPELVARIGAVMRRVRPRPLMRDLIPRQDSVVHADTIAHGRLLISLRTREVRVSDRPVSVTRKEFDLLALLASDPGTVFSRDRIMSKVWNDESSLSTRTIDTHIGTLRAKLGARAWIVTVHGIGFRLGHA